MTITVQTYVDVEIELDEIDTADLIEELESRGRHVNNDDEDHGPDLQAMFTALALGQEQEALRLLRTYLCDCLGRVM